MSKFQGDGAGERDGILVRVRLDFKGAGKPGRFLFGSKPTDKVAEEIREQQAAIFRNVPIQGIQVMDIDTSTEVYTVFDDLANAEVAYAPLVLTVKADSLESVVRLVAREDFRKVEIMDPASVSFSHQELERLLFKVHEELLEYKNRLERKYNLK